MSVSVSVGDYNTFTAKSLFLNVETWLKIHFQSTLKTELGCERPHQLYLYFLSGHHRVRMDLCYATVSVDSLRAL